MRGRILGTGLLVIGVLLTTLTPAAATDGTPEGAAELIREVAPQQGNVLAGHVRAGEVRARVGRMHVAVPLNADRAVTLDAVGLDAAAPLEVRLPAEIDVSHGRTARDGTVVYPPSDAGETLAAVQILDDGAVRLQTVTPDADAPRRFTYSFGEDVRPVIGASGGIDLLVDNGGVALVVGHVDEPWATDANGDAVATSYTIDGTNLVQIIEPDENTAYPVVADPKVTRTWWNTTVYFNKRETSTMAAGAGAVAAVAALIPDPTISKVVAAAAGLASAYASWVLGMGSCLKFVYYGHVANVWQPYGGSEAGRYCR